MPGVYSIFNKITSFHNKTARRRKYLQFIKIVLLCLRGQVNKGGLAWKMDRLGVNGYFFLV